MSANRIHVKHGIGSMRADAGTTVVNFGNCSSRNDGNQFTVHTTSAAPTLRTIPRKTKIQCYNGEVSVNGKTYKNVDTVEMVNGKLIVNGVEAATQDNPNNPPINVTINGNVKNVEVTGGGDLNLTVTGSDKTEVKSDSGDVTVFGSVEKVKSKYGNITNHGDVNHCSTEFGNIVNNKNKK